MRCWWAWAAAGARASRASQRTCKAWRSSRCGCAAHAHKPTRLAHAHCATCHVTAALRTPACMCAGCRLRSARRMGWRSGMTTCARSSAWLERPTRRLLGLWGGGACGCVCGCACVPACCCRLCRLVALHAATVAHTAMHIFSSHASAGRLSVQRHADQGGGVC